MRLYKFKSLGDTKHVLDIILNERLFCAEWKNLNDPTEGRFTCYTEDGREDAIAEKVMAVIKAKSMKRVCALSKTIDSHLLWAHYADGFGGVAIEVEVPEGDVKRVIYEDGYTMIDGLSQEDPEELANEVLCKKFHDWKYEEEYRIIKASDYYESDALVRRVIFGHRIDESLHEMLQILCEQKNIPMAKTSIGLNGEISALSYPIRDGLKYIEAIHQASMTNQQK